MYYCTVLVCFQITVLLLNIGTGLASKLLMSQIMPVGPASSVTIYKEHPFSNEHVSDL